jgi:type IV pilus assembly protein PilY1
MQRLTFFAFMAMCLLAHQVFAADMEDYCQAPPFLSDTPRPNVMLMVDASGSMSEWAYMDAYTSTKVYEGYFDPTKDYLQDASGVYQELVTGCPKQCKVKISCQKSNSGSCDPKGTHGCKSNQWACCPLDQWEIPTDCGQKSGNY